MSYVYAVEKQVVFTDECQRALLAVRDFAMSTLNVSGAVMAGNLMNKAPLANSWASMACVDRLVELGDLREVTRGEEVCWQHRVFVSGKGSA